MTAYTIPLATTLEREPPHMMPTRGMTIHAGDAVRLLITVYQRDMDATPVNLYGTTSRFWLKAGGQTCPEVLRPAFAVDFAGGRIAVDLGMAETLSMRGRAEWGLSVGFAGSPVTVARGTLDILPSHYLASDISGEELSGALVTDLGEPFVADTDGAYIAYTE